MTPNIANAVVCSVAGHTFGSLVDEHDRRLCVECGEVESSAEPDDEPTDPDPTDLYVDTSGGEG